jgi:tRNA (guanosine-2'-O-)-methyltransferase
MLSSAELKAAAADPALRARVLGLLTDHRRALIERALENRTRHVVAVIENVADSHNANAVVRSCECFGIQELHVVSEAEFKTARRILIGSGKWVDLVRHSQKTRNNAAHCLAGLKARGYRIAVTVPKAGAGVTPLDRLDLSAPLAVCFGQEHTGISGTLRAGADHFVTIPMAGFTESLNISVAAGIVFYTLTQRLRSGDVRWQLGEADKNELRLLWALRCLRNPGAILQRFLSERQPA